MEATIFSQEDIKKKIQDYMSLDDDTEMDKFAKSVSEGHLKIKDDKGNAMTPKEAILWLS